MKEEHSEKNLLMRIANGFRASRGIRKNLDGEALVELANQTVESKLEQEKTIEITSNGKVEVVADEGLTLSKVTANVNVQSGDSNKLASLIDGSITEITTEDLAGATEIKVNAFINSPNLIKITIPETIKTFKSTCFNGLGKSKQYTDIYFKTNSFDYLGGAIFYNAYANLHFNDVHSFNNYLECIINSQDNAFDNVYSWNLYFDENLITDVEIIETITEIRRRILSANGTIQKITFLGNITYLYRYSFVLTPQLKEVVFLNNTVVPTLENASMFNSATTIKIPLALYDEWISATNWSSLASKIQTI